MGHVASLVDVTRVFGDVYALRRISLDVRRGEILTLMGPNGAGKTTLTRIVATLLKPTAGDVRIEGFDAVADPVPPRRLLAIVPQGVVPDPYMTPYEHVFHYLCARGSTRRTARDATQRTLSELGLWEHRDVRAQRLSGGYQRRVILAMALATKPRLLLLDEPTTGLDPLARRHIWQTLAALRGETSILLTTHDLTEAQELSNRVAFLSAGRLVGLDTVPQLLQNLPAAEKLVIESDPPAVDLSDHGTVSRVAGRHVLFPRDRQAMSTVVELLTREGTQFSRRSTDLEDCYFHVLAIADEPDHIVPASGTSGTDGDA